MKIQSIILPLTKSSISITKSMLSTHLKDQGIQDFDLFFFEKQVCCIYNHKKDLRDNLLLKFVKDFDLEQQAIRTFLGDRPVYRNLIHNLMKARARDINYLANCNGTLSKKIVLVLEKLWKKIEDHELDIHKDRAVISRMLHETASPLY